MSSSAEFNDFVLENLNNIKGFYFKRKKMFGEYQTNWVILKTSGGDFISGPGFDSLSWVGESIRSPGAIL